MSYEQKLDAVLAAPMNPSENDARAVSVAGYLTCLLLAVWDDGEGFSGKRPFGNSGWSWDLVAPLSKAGLISAVLDEDGYVESLEDERGFERLIHDAIVRLGDRVSVPA